METRQSEDKDVLIRRAFFDAQSRRWGLVEVAHINARHAPARRGPVEGEIAMAVRALPVLDAALRSIIVLAESADNLALIREIAISVIAFVEMPAPCHPAPQEDDEEEDGV